MGWRSALGVFAVAGLLGCRPNTPRGQIGTLDLTSTLPVGVTAPTTTKAHEAEVEVCGYGKDVAPVSLRVRWTSFEQRGIGYVASCAVELQKSQGGLLVFLGKPRLTEGHDLPVVTVKVPVVCRRMNLRGETAEDLAVLHLDAAGRLSK